MYWPKCCCGYGERHWCLTWPCLFGLEISYGVAGVKCCFGVIWKCKWEVEKVLKWETINKKCVQLVQV